MVAIAEAGVRPSSKRQEVTVVEAPNGTRAVVHAADVRREELRMPSRATQRKLDANARALAHHGRRDAEERADAMERERTGDYGDGGSDVDEG